MLPKCPNEPSQYQYIYHISPLTRAANALLWTANDAVTGGAQNKLTHTQYKEPGATLLWFKEKAECLHTCSCNDDDLKPNSN